MGLELRVGFLCGFTDGFEAGHEIGNDLYDQQNRHEPRVRVQRWQVYGRAFRYTEGDEDHKKRESTKRSPVLESGAQPNTALDQASQQCCEDQPIDTDGVIR